MSWQILFRPEVEDDVAEAAEWYEARDSGLGAGFVSEVIRTWRVLAENPFLNSRRHSKRNVRWTYPERFPYRIVCEIREADHTVIVLAVLHAARDERHWRRRV